MKRAGLFIGIVLLMVGVLGGVWHWQEPRTETVKQSLPSATLIELPSPLPFEFADEVQPSNFSDQVDLWGEPWVGNAESYLSYASLNLEEEFKLASAERFQSRLDDHAEPVLTVLDRQVVYSLFGTGGFSLKVNLKPGYASPEALMPTRIDPGISGSFSF